MSFNQDMKLVVEATKQQFSLFPHLPFIIQLPDDEETDDDTPPSTDFEDIFSAQLTKMGLKLDRIAYYKGKNIAFISPINFPTQS